LILIIVTYNYSTDNDLIVILLPMETVFFGDRDDHKKSRQGTVDSDAGSQHIAEMAKVQLLGWWPGDEKRSFLE